MKFKLKSDFKPTGDQPQAIENMNIVLIGMRGSGKSTVAKLLSEKLNREHLDLDEIMVKKMRMSVPQIVKKYDWDYFRNKESEIVEEVSVYHNRIISTGGGVVIRSKNINALKKNGVFILLRASIETLLKRVERDLNRPPLINKKTRREEIETLLRQRKRSYKQVADEIIDTDNLSPKKVVNEILLRLKAKHL